jgi:hypothetical protein
MLDEWDFENDKHPNRTLCYEEFRIQIVYLKAVYAIFGHVEARDTRRDRHIGKIC